MAFLKNDTLKAMEGQFIKFQDGVERRLKLIDHKIDADDQGKQRHNILVQDVETGEEKSFFASKGFMKELSKLNSMLDVGSVIKVTPSSAQFTNTKNEVVNYLTYRIELDSPNRF